MKSLCIFGDNIVHGYTDVQKGGWVQRLKTSRWSKGEFLDVYELGIPQETSATLLSRINAELAARAPDAVLLAIGTNDVQYHHRTSQLETSEVPFEGNIRALCERVLAVCPQLYVVGLLGCDDAKTTPVSWDSDSYFYNEKMKDYDKIIARIAGDSEATYVDVFGAVTSELFADGLHPNADGHQLISERIESALFS